MGGVLRQLRERSRLVTRAYRYFHEDIWRDERELPAPRFVVLRVLRIVFIVAKGFADDMCFLRASALTYTTLLALVPVLALAFSVAKGFGVRQLDRFLEGEFAQKMFRDQAEIKDTVIGFVENINVGALGVIGLVILIWTVVKALGTIEKTFNDIWGVKTHRTLFRKFADYTSVLVICPLLILAAVTATASFASSGFVEWLRARGMAGLVEALLAAAPYVAVWIAFAAMYVFMPNTRVAFRAALAGGIVAGTLWQLALWAYTHFQVGVAKYQAIYAGFAALPLFLVWLYVSWVIVLFGAEVSFAFQNVETFRREEKALGVSYAAREHLALTLLVALARRFERGEPAWTAEELSHRLDVPVRLVRDVLFELQRVGLVIEFDRGGGETGYQPARSTESLTAADALGALRMSGEIALAPAKGPEARVAGEVLARARGGEAEAALSLRALALRASGTSRGVPP